MNITKENIVYELSSIGNIEYIDGNINITGLSNINQTLSNHYLIYEIFDRQNNKYYIGQHNTVDPLDDYMGSGFYLEHAKQKYGISNFVKIIIADFDNYDDMNESEKYFVQLSDCYPYNDRSYNLKEGGSHGHLTDKTKKILAQKDRDQWNNYSDEEKDRLRKLWSKLQSGENNPMYGRSSLEGKSNDEKEQIKKKRSQTYFSKPIEERQSIVQKRVLSMKNRTEDQKQQTKLKKQMAMYNIPEEKKQNRIESIRTKMKDLWKNEKYREKQIDNIRSRAKDPKWIERMRLVTGGENNGCYGKKRIYDPFKQKYKYVKPEEIEQYLSKGYLRNKPNS